MQRSLQLGTGVSKDSKKGVQQSLALVKNKGIITRLAGITERVHKLTLWCKSNLLDSPLTEPRGKMRYYSKTLADTTSTSSLPETGGGGRVETKDKQTLKVKNLGKPTSFLKCFPGQGFYQLQRHSSNEICHL